MKNVELGSEVTVSKADDATIYNVVSIKGFQCELVYDSLRPEPCHGGWADKSSLNAPTPIQTENWNNQFA